MSIRIVWLFYIAIIVMIISFIFLIITLTGNSKMKQERILISLILLFSSILAIVFNTDTTRYGIQIPYGTWQSIKFDIIKYYETWGGTIINGYFGVNPIAIHDFIKNNTDLKPTFHSDSINDRIDDKIKNSDAAILTYFYIGINEDKEFYAGGHHVIIQWSEDDKVFLYL